MGKKTRGKLAGLLAVVMMLSCLAGCGNERGSSSAEATARAEQAAEAGEAAELKHKLFDEWFQYLAANEQIFSCLYRALAYSECYARDGSWDSLLKARAASSAALISLMEMELPVLDLTAEEARTLTAMGIEVNVMQRSFEELEATRYEKEITATLLCNTLEYDAFLISLTEEALPAMTAFYRDSFTLECRYLCQMTNYLLLQAEQTERWDSWMEQLPCLAACADIWYDAPEDVEKACGELLDEMEVLQTNWGSVLGTSEYALEIVQDAVETGNLEGLAGEIRGFSGAPGYFPIPDWLSEPRCLYFVTDSDTQHSRLVQAGEELHAAPSACYLSCGVIAQENVEAYAAQLEGWGIETSGSWEEAGESYRITAHSGESVMIIQWTGEETEIYLTEPIGCLIPSLYLSAMNLK